MVHIKQVRGVPSYLSLATPLTPQGDTVTQVITGQKTWTTSASTNDRSALAASVPGRFDSNGTDEAAAALFGASSGIFRSTLGFWGNSEANGMLSWAPIATPVNQDFGRFMITNSRTATGDAWDPATNGGADTGVSGLVQYYAEFPALRQSVPVASPSDYADETGLPAPPLTFGHLKLFARQGNPAYGYEASPGREFGLSYLSYSVPSGSIEEDIATYQRADVRYGAAQVSHIHVDTWSPSTTIYPFVAPGDVRITQLALIGSATVATSTLSGYNHAQVSPGYLFSASPVSAIGAGSPVSYSPDQYRTMAQGDWLSLSWAGSSSPLTNLTISVSYNPIYPS